MLQQGEDLLRESGIPYLIVRPCALTEEPAGADLIFDQGDNITVSWKQKMDAFLSLHSLWLNCLSHNTFILGLF